MSYTRISGRRGQPVDLDVTFYNNGVAANPFAIRRVKIYKQSIAPHNLIDTIDIVSPFDENYPAPVSVFANAEDELVPGMFLLTYVPASDADVPNVYYDVWEYWSTDPRDEACGGTEDPTECNLDDFESSLISCCHKFFLYPDNWVCSDSLETIEFAFEPLHQKFYQPEKRPLQIGVMPTPLYDYNRGLIMPMLPYLQAAITIKTRHCEMLVDGEEMTIGLRQGSYRDNPYVLRWTLDTGNFLKGTYQYRIVVTLPDGTTRVSPDFFFSVI